MVHVHSVSCDDCHSTSYDGPCTCMHTALCTPAVLIQHPVVSKDRCMDVAHAVNPLLLSEHSQSERSSHYVAASHQKRSDLFVPVLTVIIIIITSDTQAPTGRGSGRLLFALTFLPNMQLGSAGIP